MDRCPTKGPLIVLAQQLCDHNALPPCGVQRAAVMASFKISTLARTIALSHELSRMDIVGRRCAARAPRASTPERWMMDARWTSAAMSPTVFCFALCKYARREMLDELASSSGFVTLMFALWRIRRSQRRRRRIREETKMHHGPPGQPVWGNERRVQSTGGRTLIRRGHEINAPEEDNPAGAFSIGLSSRARTATGVTTGFGAADRVSIGCAVKARAGAASAWSADSRSTAAMHRKLAGPFRSDELTAARAHAHRGGGPRSAVSPDRPARG
jgi:hypothetical protein